MRTSALIVPTVVALLCVGCSTSPITAADDPPNYASEDARTDLVCAEDDESVGEAQEPLSGLSIACLLLVAVAVEIGCNEGAIDGWCPPGTTKTITDTWDKTKTMTISCDVLRYFVCGTAAAGGVELMRRACLAA